MHHLILPIPRGALRQKLSLVEVDVWLEWPIHINKLNNTKSFHSNKQYFNDLELSELYTYSAYSLLKHLQRLLMLLMA